MNRLHFILIFTLAVFTTPLFAQPDQASKSLEFKIQQLPDQSWGIFVKPNSLIVPSNRTITGSGQVTIVTPINFTYSNFINYGGSWIENARVNGPNEAADKAYVSFGFVIDNPKIKLYPNEETLLFTFTTEESFHGTFRLFENQADPFMPSNSYDSNPGNDIGVIDPGTGNGLQYYAYGGNYESDEAEAVFSSQKMETEKPRSDSNKPD